MKSKKWSLLRPECYNLISRMEDTPTTKLLNTFLVMKTMTVQISEWFAGRSPASSKAKSKEKGSQLKKILRTQEIRNRHP
jgi:hypothetical protein